MNVLHQVSVAYRLARRKLHVRLVRSYAKRLRNATRIPHKGPDYFAIGRKDRF